jgi:tRNA G18 (ribose-2'-O)-methylase SpoU
MPTKAALIEDVDDPRIASYANVRDRDLAGREGTFIVEGEVVVRMLLARSSRFRPRSLFLEERRVEKLADALAALPHDVPLYTATQAVMDRIVGFHIHRGVLALADRGPPLSADALCAAPGPRSLVGLVGVVNHDNVGGIFRSAAAFGTAGVLLDPVTCDPLYRKAVRVSVGGALVVPFARCESDQALVDVLTRHGYDLLALSARGDVDVDRLPPAPRRALLVGAEGPGLPAEVLARATRVRIAMSGPLDSLNASVACGIALHSVTRAPSAR